MRDAAEYYDQRQPGLGDEFLDHVVRTLRLVRERPESFAEILSDVRRASVSRFPYGIFYRAMSDRIVVLAVYHASRNPRGIDDRI
ncbi:MAG: type II toxin-antitoxin system RelE/ParE family toxin [Planctomycetaceae bacterium]|nr:type II toxin-antitoxin system RelE/ParE family toxin [Planctomycetaceae bacterium]